MEALGTVRGRLQSKLPEPAFFSAVEVVEIEQPDAVELEEMGSLFFYYFETLGAVRPRLQGSAAAAASVSGVEVLPLPPPVQASPNLPSFFLLQIAAESSGAAPSRGGSVLCTWCFLRRHSPLAVGHPQSVCSSVKVRACGTCFGSSELFLKGRSQSFCRKRSAIFFALWYINNIYIYISLLRRLFTDEALERIRIIRFSDCPFPVHHPPPGHHTSPDVRVVHFTGQGFRTLNASL